MIKFADKTCKERILQLIKDMYERPPTEWEDCTKVGSVAVAKLEGMLVMHCMSNAVLEYQFFLQIPSTS